MFNTRKDKVKTNSIAQKAEGKKLKPPQAPTSGFHSSMDPVGEEEKTKARPSAAAAPFHAPVLNPPTEPKESLHHKFISEMAKELRRFFNEKIDVIEKNADKAKLAAIGSVLATSSMQATSQAFGAGGDLALATGAGAIPGAALKGASAIMDIAILINTAVQANKEMESQKKLGKALYIVALLKKHFPEAVNEWVQSDSSSAPASILTRAANIEFFICLRKASEIQAKQVAEKLCLEHYYLIKELNPQGISKFIELLIHAIRNQVIITIGSATEFDPDKILLNAAFPQWKLLHTAKKKIKWIKLADGKGINYRDYFYQASYIKKQKDEKEEVRFQKFKPTLSGLDDNGLAALTQAQAEAIKKQFDDVGEEVTELSESPPLVVISYNGNVEQDRESKYIRLEKDASFTISTDFLTAYMKAYPKQEKKEDKKDETSVALPGKSSGPHSVSVSLESSRRQEEINRLKTKKEKLKTELDQCRQELLRLEQEQFASRVTKEVVKALAANPSAFMFASRPQAKAGQETRRKNSAPY